MTHASLDGPSEYRTLAATHQHEVEISRSRFLALLSPAATEEDARACVATARRGHPQARHHCTAFVLGPRRDVRRTSDDGEPSGTAGAPMLDALLAAEVSDVVAVVVRHFGGVLLGTGGLARAYRGAVADALAGAPLVLRRRRTLLRVTLDYADAAAVTALAERAGWGVSARYGVDVELDLAVPPDAAVASVTRIAATTAGRGRATPSGTAWVDQPWPDHPQDETHHTRAPGTA